MALDMGPQDQVTEVDEKLPRAILTIHTVDEDGLGALTHTYIAKVGEPLEVAQPLTTHIASIVIDRMEED